MVETESRLVFARCCEEGNGSAFAVASEVQLIYNAVLVSSVEQSDLVIHTYLFSLRFFSRIDYYKTLSRVPYTIH